MLSYDLCNYWYLQLMFVLWAYGEKGTGKKKNSLYKYTLWTLMCSYKIEAVIDFFQKSLFLVLDWALREYETTLVRIQHPATNTDFEEVSIMFWTELRKEHNYTIVWLCKKKKWGKKNTCFCKIMKTLATFLTLKVGA